MRPSGVFGSKLIRVSPRGVSREKVFSPIPSKGSRGTRTQVDHLAIDLQLPCSGRDRLLLHIHHLSSIEDDEGDLSAIALFRNERPKIENRTCSLRKRTSARSRNLLLGDRLPILCYERSSRLSHDLGGGRSILPHVSDPKDRNEEEKFSYGATSLAGDRGSCVLHDRTI